MIEVESGETVAVTYWAPSQRAVGWSMAVGRPVRMVTALVGPCQPCCWPSQDSLTTMFRSRPQLIHTLGVEAVCPLPLCSVSQATPERPGAVPEVHQARAPWMMALLR